MAKCVKLCAVTACPLPTYRGSYKAPPADEPVEHLDTPPVGVPSLGARMLAAMSSSARKDVARRAGKSGTLIHRWGTGERYPGEQERDLMRDVGIPPEAWELYQAKDLPGCAAVPSDDCRVPQSSPRARAPKAAPSPPPEWTPGEDDFPSLSSGTLLDRITSVLHYLTRQERTPEQVAQAREIRQLLALDARARGQMAVKGALEDHPDFPALVETLLDAVESFPGGIDRLLAVLKERKAAPAAQRVAA
jgi:hypothetical protein